MGNTLARYSLRAVAVTVLLASGICSRTQNNRPAATANQDNGPYKLAVRANLVIVPVIVIDKHGNHVTGLHAEDFEVKEDGSVQKISRIDELTTESTRVARPELQPNSFSNALIADHPKKLEIVALDQLNTPFASSAEANRGLLNYLAKNVDSNTLLALVALRGDGVRLIHNFTSDPSVLTAAITKAQATLNVHDALTQSVNREGSEADIEVGMIQALLAPVDFSTPAGARAALVQGQAQMDASRQSQASLITLECLQQLAQYFSGVPGRKSLIWASTAFPFSLGASGEEMTRGTTNDDWQRTFRMLQDANIAVYPVDVGGLAQNSTANNLQNINSRAMQNAGAEGGVGARHGQLDANTNGTFIDPSVARQQTMHHLADVTGGQAFYNSNDLSELFRRAGEDCSQYYMLAYYTSNTAKAGWKKLSVKVRQDGARVRSRNGFYYRPAGANADSTRLSDELMAMTSDMSFASLPIGGRWLQVEPAGDQRKVHFELSIPAGVPMVDAEHDRHISLDFRVIATDSSGKTVGNIGQRMETNLPPEDALTIQTKGIDYANELTLPPGEYKVHFIVRDNLRESLGSVVTSLRVQ